MKVARNGALIEVVMCASEVMKLLSEYVSKILLEKYDNPVNIAGVYESLEKDKMLQIRFVLKQNDIVQEIEL